MDIRWIFVAGRAAPGRKAPVASAEPGGAATPRRLRGIARVRAQISPVASGAFSSVWEGVDAGGAAVALKRIAKVEVKSLKTLRNIVAELRALRALSGGCVQLLELRGVMASRKYLYFVLEHFGVELYARVRRADSSPMWIAAPPRCYDVDISPTPHGDAAATTWIFCGNGDAAMPRPRRAYSAETGRGRGRDADRP